MNQTPTEPLVSVIVPNYNYARYLEHRLQSIVTQTFRDFEIIILDDASTDNSVEIIERWRGHEKVSCIETNNRNSGSPFKQWEKGIEMAKGQYIWIAEADDLAESTFLEKCVAILDCDKRIALVKTMSKFIDANDNDIPQRAFEKYIPDNKGYIYNGQEYIKHRMLKANSFYNASMILFRKDAYNRLEDRSYMELKYSGDWLLWGLMMPGALVGEIHEKLSCFRLHGQSVTDKRELCPDLSRAEDEYVKWMLGNNADISDIRFRAYSDYRLGKIGRDPHLAGVKKEIANLSEEMLSDILRLSTGKRKQWITKHTLSLLPESKLHNQVSIELK